VPHPTAERAIEPATGSGISGSTEEGRGSTEEGRGTTAIVEHTVEDLGVYHFEYKE
jgi:hypothetical protein